MRSSLPYCAPFRPIAMQLSPASGPTTSSRRALPAGSVPRTAKCRGPAGAVILFRIPVSDHVHCRVWIAASARREIRRRRRRAARWIRAMVETAEGGGPVAVGPRIVPQVVDRPLALALVPVGRPPAKGAE